ncbi:hypothetical protein [Halorussus lipolyticus]|uniref:hypothetical protein n=1 Tax=Halorussus lipolyticus TaxID=3034024 RepID=UPI0023E8437E|nr:hypothetical protein [Halorussus sp. DT80]
MRRQLHPLSPSIPWHTTYLTVIVLALGFVVAIAQLRPAFRGVFEFLPAGLVVGVFSITSLLYWYDVSDHRIRERRP